MGCVPLQRREEVDKEGGMARKEEAEEEELQGKYMYVHAVLLVEGKLVLLKNCGYVCATTSLEGHKEDLTALA